MTPQPNGGAQRAGRKLRPRNADRTLKRKEKVKIILDTRCP